jgi:hypothetical protein
MTNINRKDIADNTAFQGFLARVNLFGYVEVTNYGEVEIYREHTQAPQAGTFLGYRLRHNGAVLASGQLSLSLSTFDGLVSYSGEPPTLQQEIDALAVRVTALEQA